MNEKPPMLENVQGVLFDMDGTLAENAHFHHDAWIEKMFERYGYHVAPDETRVHGGKTPFIVASLLGREIDPLEAAEFHGFKEARYRDLARGKITAVAGLMPYLDWLEARGIRRAIVTSADATNADFVLEALGIRDRFESVVLGEDVQKGKPDPEPFLLGAARLGLEGSACLAHEDAPVGVQSASRAGARVVGMLTLQSSEALLEAGATWTVRDYSEWLRVLEANT
jgi:HAD superfamily hydrolase (TIGR01509 family)